MKFQLRRCSKVHLSFTILQSKLQVNLNKTRVVNSVALHEKTILQILASHPEDLLVADKTFKRKTLLDRVASDRND